MNTYEITYESRFKISERDIITVRWEDNDCDDIKKGDIVILNDGEYKVEGVETFKKSFNKEGENFGLIINKIK